MKSKFYLAAAIAALSFAAHATQGNNGGGNGGCGVGQQTNGCRGTTSPVSSDNTNSSTSSANAGAIGVGVGLGIGVGYGQGGAGGAGGQGGSAAQTQTAQGGQGGNSSATGGAGGAGGTSIAAGGSATGGIATGQGSGNSTSVNIAGSTNTTTYREAAQSAYAPQTAAPRTSCRIFIGLGGSSRDGSLSGGIPIGNDSSCLAGLQLEMMDKVNALSAGTFTANDYLTAVCRVEGMENMMACKAR